MFLTHIVYTIVMQSTDPSKKKSAMKFDRVIVNIPKTLLFDFDLICRLKSYSRPEAIKQAMRDFIVNTMGEDWKYPAEQEVEKQLIANYMEGLAVGAARASKNPEVKKAQQEQEAQQRYPPL